MAISNLMVLVGQDQVEPEGWTKIPRDLNAGAGGAYLYFAYETDQYSMLGPITNIFFLTDPEQPVPPGYRKLPTDLNKGAGGKFVYACYTRDPEKGQPVQALDVVLTDDSGYQPSKPWERYDTDLNAGAGGKYVYLIHM